MSLGSLLQATRWTVFFQSRVVPGAKVYTYLSGTMTPAPLYQDRACTVPHSNPLEADVYGMLPVAYLDYHSYRMLVTTAAGATVIPETDGVTDFAQLLIGGPSSFTDPLYGSVWLPISRVWVPTVNVKQPIVYIDGNSGAIMGSIAANNTPQQVMLKDTWYLIDLAPHNIPERTVAIEMTAFFVSSGYAGSPPVSLTISSRIPGSAAAGGDYWGAATAATSGGFRQMATAVVPIVNRQFEIYYQAPVSAIDAPQVIQITMGAIYEGPAA